ncbi:RNA polymerase sigma factor SigF [Modestobacter altitudinis]|uniref:RNA polymerase sigma factor SigF n=1 Tax=Modestobacter altitudinis TaxID=2213158 RepID=UPI00110D0C65|nr:RNA polymerase sigma factor SigF [Modestobacter altitudinis]
MTPSAATDSPAADDAAVLDVGEPARPRTPADDAPVVPGAAPETLETTTDPDDAPTQRDPADPAPDDVVVEAVEVVETAEVAAAPEAPAPVPLSENRSRSERTAPLFLELSTLEKGDPRRERLREILVEEHLPLVRHFARRFSNRGEPFDDLLQVGTLGLIAAIDRFDPTRGVEFLSFAVPTITGEIKRHFRDQGWSVRVPRRLQELHLSLNAAVSELSQKNGHAPTPSELAEHLGIPRAEVLEGLAVANAYRSSSLDERLSGEEDSPTLAATLGEEDAALEGVEYRESLQPLLATIPARERRILILRFFGNMTQSQIAADIGISQMHVSRLLSQTLAKLREGLLKD